MSLLKDKVSIITGASSGIGAGIARYFASQGAKLLLTGRDATRLQNVAMECEQLGLDKTDIHQVVVDITSDAGMKTIIDETISYFGRLDVLINNAGITLLGDIASTDMERYDHLMKVNLRTPFNMIRLAIPELKKSKGNIINIGSASTLKIVDGVAAYVTSKGGLDYLTKCAASELGPSGVRVNAVLAGGVFTSILENAGVPRDMTKEIFEKGIKFHALERLGRTDEIARVVGFIASDDASFMTGSLVPCDGGASIKGSSM